MQVLRSRIPTEIPGGIVHCSRMIDKIRLHHRDACPAEYRPRLGRDFAGRCAHFLKTGHPALIDRVINIDSDNALLARYFAKGRRPPDGEIEVGNEFTRKRDWNAAATPRLAERKAASRLPAREDVSTFFPSLHAYEDRF